MYTLQREKRKATGVIEMLPGDIPLELMIIPAGSFEMGSPANELERFYREGPVHTVSLQSFALGRYAVTQAQWRAVAENLKKVEIYLNPDPSNFKGSDRPVEEVNWLEAVEFCKRLSIHTGRQYSLPSEAQWEYACRAGTTTPFHFGETLSAEVANYDASVIYGEGTEGEYRQETTPVGSLGLANAFGLYDMHGNVWEWCQDHFHPSYEGAPTDGSAWLDETPSGEERRLLRGGSWLISPRFCRSAYRYNYAPDSRLNLLGFRVLLVSART